MNNTAAAATPSPFAGGSNAAAPAVVQDDDNTPWKVEFVEALPQPVAAELRNSGDNYYTSATTYVTCAQSQLQGGGREKWRAIATVVAPVPPPRQQPSHHHHYKVQLWVWYIPTQISMTLQQQKHNPHVLKLSHELLYLREDELPNNNASGSGLQLALVQQDNTSAISDGNDDPVVHLYVATNRHLMLWKLSSRGDFNNNTNNPNNKSPAYIRPLSGNTTVTTENNNNTRNSTEKGDDDEDDDDAGGGVAVTSLLVHWEATKQFAILGTSNGHLYYVLQTKVPLSLRLIKIVNTPTNKSLFGRLWNTVQYHEPDSAIVDVLLVPPMTTTTNDDLLLLSSPPARRHQQQQTTTMMSLVSIEQKGKLVHWKMDFAATAATRSSTAAASSSVLAPPTFEMASQLSLSDLLKHQQQQLQACPILSTIPPLGYQGLTIRRAIFSKGEENDNTQFLHVIAITEHTDGDVRLYWLILAMKMEDETTSESNESRGSKQFELRHAHYLDRFIAPAQVQLLGLAASHNGRDVYAGFLPDGGDVQHQSSPVFMAWSRDNTPDRLYEMDLQHINMQLSPNPQRTPGSSSNNNNNNALRRHPVLSKSLVPDTVTHGITCMEASGFGLQVRLMVDHPQRRSVSEGTTGSSASSSNLANHLHASFWDSYKAPDGTIRLPPSLAKMCSPFDLEVAVDKVSKQLQKKLTASGAAVHTGNPLEWHQAYVNFLQQSGLYRNLSEVSKWKLLSIGQELFVYATLTQNLDQQQEHQSLWEEDCLRALKPYDIGKWLKNVQDQVLSPDGSSRGDEEIQHLQEVWLQLLDTSLDAAMKFREDHGRTYDIASVSDPPQCVVGGDSSNSTATTHVPIWTCNRHIRNVLMQQLVYMDETSTVGASPQILKSILQNAVHACYDSYRACHHPQTREDFIYAQNKSFEILRKVQGLEADHFLFELGTAFGYFKGLCQVALDHEKRSDRDDFNLIPLFEHLDQKQDIETGLLFAPFVLMWHTDRELFGHVLHYGKYCHDALSSVLNNVEALAPYRWIHAVRMGDYNAAAESLFSNAQSQDVTLAQSQTAVSLAKIANTVAQDESLQGSALQETSAKRRRLIEKRTELINAQKDFFRDADDSIVMEPRELLNKVIRHFNSLSDSKDEKIQDLVIALAVCTTFEDDSEIHDGALMVWFKAILADNPLWKKWLSQETDLTDASLRDLVLQNTVFGGLLQQSDEMDEWGDVRYGPEIERAVFDKLGDLEPMLQNRGMQRLLRSATSEDHELSRGIGNDAMVLA